MKGKVVVVGLGPGDERLRTPAATAALEGADLFVGYKGYLDQLSDFRPSVPRVSTGMTGEVARCQEAVKRASEGANVALVCSGDAGIYGMASLVCQLAHPLGVEVTIEPGVTAATAAAALMGAPLGHDLAFISLSDRLTPWDLILKRLRLAAEADLCLCLYNPVSHGRPEHLKNACTTLMEVIPPTRPCGWARQVGREGQEVHLCTLEELAQSKLDMFCLCIIGNSMTQQLGSWLVTPRGYKGVE